MRPLSLLAGGLALATLLAACQPQPYAAANRSYQKQVKAYARNLRTTPLQADATWPRGDYWVGTTNFNMRKPNFVVIHHTAQDSTAQTLRTFTLPRTQVSAHYVIGRDGKVYHMLHDYLRAWHGGQSKWGNTTDLNSVSIGIELDNNGSEPFPEAQVASLLQVLANLKKTHGIPAANFIGHSDIAPSRKNDPSPAFPWARLAEHGFGLWYDPDVPDPVAAAPIDTVLSPPDSTNLAPDTLGPVFDPLEALRIIGYDIRNPEAAIKAFKLHFIQKDINTVLTPRDKRILYNLYKKYY